MCISEPLPNVTEPPKRIWPLCVCEYPVSIFPFTATVESPKALPLPDVDGAALEINFRVAPEEIVEVPVKVLLPSALAGFIVAVPLVTSNVLPVPVSTAVIVPPAMVTLVFRVDVPFSIVPPEIDTPPARTRFADPRFKVPALTVVVPV